MKRTIVFGIYIGVPCIGKLPNPSIAYTKSLDSPSKACRWDDGISAAMQKAWEMGGQIILTSTHLAVCVEGSPRMGLLRACPR